MQFQPTKLYQTLKGWGMQRAAGLTMALSCYGFMATDPSFVAYVLNALSAQMVVTAVMDLGRRIFNGEDPEAMKEEITALVNPANEAALGELQAVLQSLLDKEMGDLREKLGQELVEAAREETRASQEVRDRRLLNVAGASPFRIRGSVDGLLKAVNRVAGHGLANVVDRPESSAIVEALQGRRTRQVFLLGRALSGKTFLAFKVAQRWIVSGGLVGWMRTGDTISHYIAAVQTEAAANRRLPLIIWEIPDRGVIREEVLEQLQGYDGPVLITLRAGGWRNPPADLEDMLEDHGFAKGRIDGKRLSPSEGKVRLELGPVEDPGAVLSAIVRADGSGLTLSRKAREYIAQRITVHGGEGDTTLLGLGRTYVMALKRAGLTRADRREVWDLEGPNRKHLTKDSLVEQIFGQTVDEKDKEFLAVFKLYKSWTHVEVLHQDVLTAIIAALGRTGNGRVADRRNELTQRGVLIFNEPMYSVWHDLQLDLTPHKWEMTSGEVLPETISLLISGMKGSDQETRKDELAGAAEVFAQDLHKNGHWNEAQGLLHSALDIRRYHKVGGTDKKMLNKLAATCNDLGNTLADMGRWQKARKLYEEALEIDRYLAREQHKAYTHHVATTCNNLGNLLAETGRWQEARERYEEALKIRRAQARYQPKAYNPHVANTCNNLGVLLKNLGKRQKNKRFYKEALKNFREALDIYCDLARDQPKAYNPEVAMTYNNLGNLLADMGRRRVAKEIYEKALKICRDLARVQPKAYNLSVAITCNNLGTLLAGMGQRHEARKHYEEAHNLFGDLAREQPKAYNLDVAMTCNNLGNLLADMGQYEEASKLYTEALMLHYECWMELPKAYEERLGYSFSSISRLANTLEFKDRQQWLAELWREMLGRFGVALAPRCQQMGQIFTEAGLPSLAMEPYSLLALEQEKQGGPAASQAANLVESLRPVLGVEFEPLRQRLREKFAPLVADQ